MEELKLMVLRRVPFMLMLESKLVARVWEYVF
jgi:hypothetical protein